MGINMKHELPTSQMWRYYRKKWDHVEISWPAVVCMESLTASSYLWMVYCAHHRHCTPTTTCRDVLSCASLHQKPYYTHHSNTDAHHSVCTDCSITIVLNKCLITDITAKWELPSKCALCYHVTHENQRQSTHISAIWVLTIMYTYMSFNNSL
jgi:hypothetical protein